MRMFQGSYYRVASILAVLTLGGEAVARGAPLSASQVQQVAVHIKAAAALDEQDPVGALRHLREALRLEQLWSSNTLGDDSTASRAMERFTTRLVRRDDDRLMRILHSLNVPLADKLSLIRVLEDEIILRYPGVKGDRLLQEYTD